VFFSTIVRSSCPFSFAIVLTVILWLLITLFCRFKPFLRDLICQLSDNVIPSENSNTYNEVINGCRAVKFRTTGETIRSHRITVNTIAKEKGQEVLTMVEKNTTEKTRD
jgi:hypothetical protein